MASELFVDNITGKTGTSGSAPITLSGDTATLGGGVSMASGLTVRNITQVALSSDVTVTNSTAETTVFTPTYTPLFSGSKVMGILNLVLQCIGQNQAEGRKKLVLKYSGDDITNINQLEDIIETHGPYDYGNSGLIVTYSESILGPLLTTSGTSLITCTITCSNKATGSDCRFDIFGNNNLKETFFTWIEYK